jgi:hypothetical protein
MVTLALALALAAGPITSSAESSPFPPTHGGDQRGPSIEALMYDYETQAKALQTEMVALKKSDGGELTSEHQAYLQKKLIALLDAYHNEVRQADPMVVNADGSPGR